LKERKEREKGKRERKEKGKMEKEKQEGRRKIWAIEPAG
jgi:hypothetical protein